MTGATAERWRLCTRHAGYLVSDRGRVRRIGGRILRPATTNRGYAKVNLGTRVQVYVHQLVTEAFHGPKPTASHQVDHLDWNRLNNAASNLRWLPAAVNRCRWQDRVGGRNVWELLVKGEPAPDGYAPMSAHDQDRLHDELAAAGWYDPEPALTP